MKTPKIEEFYRAVGEPDYHGFPSSSPWDDLAAMLRSRRIFMNFREIERDLGEGRVLVREGGEMTMPSGYSAALTAALCHEEGVFVHAVVPPVVERGKSILRATVMANHDQEDLRRAARVIARAIARAEKETTPLEAASM